MRNKRYTNVNFTKRVDHEEGLRPVRAGSEPARCARCGAVYVRRRWRWNDSPSALGSERAIRSVICPACRKGEPAPGGIVQMTGSYFASHGDDIVRLVENETQRAAEDNPLARIIKLQRRKDGVTILTTTEHLAQRLGHALEKAFHGDLRTVFSHENKFTRVFWKRD